jgi:hypothetical protein
MCQVLTFQNLRSRSFNEIRLRLSNQFDSSQLDDLLHHHHLLRRFLQGSFELLLDSLAPQRPFELAPSRRILLQFSFLVFFTLRLQDRSIELAMGRVASIKNLLPRDHESLLLEPCFILLDIVADSL